MVSNATTGPPFMEGVGHNVPQEAPQAFVDAVVEVAGY